MTSSTAFAETPTRSRTTWRSSSVALFQSTDAKGQKTMEAVFNFWKYQQVGMEMLRLETTWIKLQFLLCFLSAWYGILTDTHRYVHSYRDWSATGTQRLCPPPASSVISYRVWTNMSRVWTGWNECNKCNEWLLYNVIPYKIFQEIWMQCFSVISIQRYWDSNTAVARYCTFQPEVTIWASWWIKQTTQDAPLTSWGLNVS